MTTYQILVNKFRRKLLTDALIRREGIILKACAELEIHRNSFTRYCAELGVDPRAIRGRFTGRTEWKRKKLKPYTPNRGRKPPQRHSTDEIVAASERLAMLERGMHA